MEKDQKKTLYRIGLPIILGTILLIGVSYAWLTLTLNGTKTNVLKAGTLSLTLTDDATEGINLENTVPMLDEVGVTTNPYSFTLTNNGDIDSGYTIYLDDVALDTSETRLADTVIKYNLVKDGASKATALLSTTGTSPNRVLDSGTIKPGEVYSYDLRLWIDQDATTAISGQVFKGKIRVEASQTSPKEVTPESCFTFDESKGAITRYKCGAKVWKGSSLVDATADLLPEGIDEPITDVVIPKTINGVAVTEIGDAGFYDNVLTSVTIPDSVTIIGEMAFAENQLTNVVIPEGVTTIGDYEFNRNQLTSVVIPDSVTTIGGYAFCVNQLTSITIPNSVITIGEGAFESNQLTSVTIPNSVTYIGAAAFNENQLPDSQAFIYARNSDGTEDKTTIVSYGGAKKDNLIIPEGVTTIGDFAFQANQFESVTIPDSVITIGGYAFAGNNLTEVEIPYSVTTIGEYAFFDNQLTSVTIPVSVTTIREMAFEYNQLTSVIIEGKSSSADFEEYGPEAIWGWADGYSDDNIIWQP